MPSTYLSLHYYLIFSTKNREPVIHAEWIARLHEFLGGTVRGLGGIPECIGGVTDHVHLLVGLRATHCLSDFMRDLKVSSSKWVHEKICLPSFGWQEGYAAFTVGPTSRRSVKKYIGGQEEHHRKRSFRDELVDLLERAGVEFNPAYLD